jgi:hypothetical protein
MGDIEPFRIREMRIDERFEVGFHMPMMFQSSVEPVWCRWVLYPGMLDADVVGNDVENDFHASSMHGIYEASIIVQ